MPSILAYVHAYQGHGREAGAETTLANLLEALVKEGWTANVLLTDKRVGSYNLNGVNVWSEKDGNDLILTAPDHDYLISHLECSERASLVAQKFGKPIVQVIHNTFWQTSGYLQVGCSLAVFNSEWVRDHHEGTKLGPVVSVPRKEGSLGLGMPDHINFMVPKRRSWESVVVHPQIEAARYRGIRADHDSVTLINLHKNKGPEIFWALADLYPDTPFLAVRGGYGDQEIPDEVPQNVTIMDNQDDIRHVYARTKVLLVPSKYESFGRVAVEAAALGIPTICTPTPGLTEAMGSGALYAETEGAFSGHLGQLLNFPGHYEKMSLAALNRSRFWDAVRVQETRAFIDKLQGILPNT